MDDDNADLEYFRENLKRALKVSPVVLHAQEDLTDTVVRNIEFAKTEKFFGEMLEIRKLLGMRPHGRDAKLKFLDVGCGVGGVREHFALEVEYYGFDLSPFALKMVEPWFQDRVWLDNAESMTSAEAEFDAAVMSHLIEHLWRPDLALQEVALRLARGGKLVVLTPNAWFVNVHRPTNWLRGYEIDSTTVQFFSVRSLTRALMRAGLRVRECYTFGKIVFGQRERLIALATKE